MNRKENGYSIGKPSFRSESDGLELQISPTDMCDFHCIMCMQTAHKGLYGKPEIKAPIMHGGRRGFMNLNLYNNLMDELSASNLVFRHLKLQWMGEAFLHPDFDSMIEKAAHTGVFPQIVMNTHAGRLDGKIVAALEEASNHSGIVLILSIDAISEDTYRRIKGVNCFEEILLKCLKALNILGNVTFVAQMIVMDENQHEASAFIDVWKTYFFNAGRACEVIYDQEAVYDRPEKCKIFLKKVGSGDDEKYSALHREILIKEGIVGDNNDCIDREILHRKYSYLKAILADTIPPCPAPFRTPLVNWDGKLTTCCMDTELENCWGDINESSFIKAWTGRKLTMIRQAHLRGDRSLLPRCRRCSNLDAEGLTEMEVKRVKN